ncbi:MAG: hypothetical protein A3G02_00165 [Candidatus Yanofskybacteria bacterium RIFCSPLOWO2_12_FULL_44_13b]|uniref:Uncharacterized protein n=1 Tax=Candidatus Yanofskybacteria bacterium RIFCSPLOWO2_02_FULL_44_18 TaxID=1802705 RepID=A0A1F8H395_9BACT|nr:MAG: hypothetical protein A2657_01005 [Candidatus Yanofskybacteria bacterium RIFCSPHIGHO2_01_FULL_44_110b]OGN15163.1 MAG: hypothetical protein A3C01_01830 [Candidatus Yanofskybacteria bacterium RIFCSPHIGHO2_02_FULL_44_36b]OGN18440.1 MAG: hypothetical protein A3F50_01420 [Candidatus Yanofskybacteria bacterium RIFCSPHIGHO2_12_FULL_44_29b]OGN26591.1 MAG: hypothetical protein A3B12_01160 [Candidatus Yanofskybacteria bacterium RIFCSPLOWO2_01_FULL_44_88]OGN31269.1 MAG: hypothetical protein A3I96_0
MSFIKKHQAYLLLSLAILTIGYFVFIQGEDDEDLLVDGWVCPEEDVDINFTLAYMSKVDMNGVFKIIDFLKSQGCDMALQKLQARMSADIEAGISPGSQP